MGKAMVQSDAPFNEPPRPPFAAFLGDETARRLVARFASDRGWPAETVRGGTVAEAVLALDGQPTPEVLVIDLSDAADAPAAANRLAEVCDPGTVVIGVGTVNDVNLFRQLIALGLADYLLKPLTLDILTGAVDRALVVPEPDPQPGDRARVLVVTGARGGTGATTVAINIAWLLAEDHQARVALVDMDLQFGTTALALDLEPGRGFREALENPARVDSLFMERAMVRHGDRLALLCAEEALDKPLAPQGEAIGLILDHLNEDRDWIVVDAPRRMLADNPALLAKATHVLLVSDPTLAGMRDTLRLKAFTKGVNPGAEISVIGSRVGLLKKGELDRATFEKGAEVSLRALLPFDPVAAAAGVEKGQPLCVAAKGSKVAQALRGLTESLSGDGAASGGLFARLFHHRA
jgi:pilus assembly protein CpaE